MKFQEKTGFLNTILGAIITLFVIMLGFCLFFLINFNFDCRAIN
jgi:D-alanyl-lipoteichoic acid acyltransferase DltB (MBOAT superfamily)